MPSCKQARVGQAPLLQGTLHMTGSHGSTHFARVYKIAPETSTNAIRLLYVPSCLQMSQVKIRTNFQRGSEIHTERGDGDCGMQSDVRSGDKSVELCMESEKVKSSTVAP